MTVPKNNRRIFQIILIVVSLVRNDSFCQQRIDSAHAFVTTYWSSFACAMSADGLELISNRILIKDTSASILYQEVRQIVDSLSRKGLLLQNKSKYAMDCRLRVDFFSAGKIQQFVFARHGYGYFNEAVFKIDPLIIKPIVERIPAIKEELRL